MKLSAALGLRGHESIAIVGAGGNKSAMLTLATELPSTVILTTDQHTDTWQTKFANRHLILHSPEELSEIKPGTGEKIIIIGPIIPDDPMSSLDSLTLNAIHSFCQKHKIHLMIEVDDSQQRPLKEPGAPEPVLPDWVEIVLVVANLKGFGKRSHDKTVHSPEQFSAINGLSKNQIISADDILVFRESEIDSLRNIPKGSQKYLLLNQAEGDLLQAQGKWLAQHLIPFYDRILVGSLANPGEKSSILSVHTHTAGIILAAGGSDRLGHSKQFLNWAGKLYILQVAETAIAADLKPLIVVTGEDHAAITNALRDYPVEIVHNSNWAEGQSTSMRSGLASLPDNVDSTVFLLCDQPHISPLLIRSLIERRAETRAPIVAPTTGGKRGNPVLFGRETFEALMTVTGDRGGRAVFNQFNVEWLPWVDSRIALDVDQPGDEEILYRAYFGFE